MGFYPYILVLTLSVVIGIRVPRELKRKLDELGIKYSEKVRRFLEELVWKENMRRILENIYRIRRRIGRVKGNLSAQFIREDRDER